MSTYGNEINLAGAVPNEAISVSEAKPDIRSAYNTTSASGGEISSQIESAASNGQILDLGSGTYDMTSGVSISGGVGGIVGDGRDSCTINCSASSFLFNVSGASDFVMEGVTFQADGDVALANAEISGTGWFEDVVFRGQRDKYGAGGERFTFLIEATSDSATNFIHRCEFPDGGTNHPDRDSVGHAIGPNADPSHVGLNVWKECYAEGFMDNGFYVNDSPGRNVLWNCTAVNNGGGNMRLGNNDIVVGGYSEVTSMPDDRHGKPLEVNSGGNVHVIGLEMYGESGAVGGGTQVIQIRSEAEDITLDRTVAHANGVGSYLARLDVADIEITDSWWLQENTSSTAVQENVLSGSANITADSTWRLRNGNGEELSGSFTIDGTGYSGTTSASDAGLGDPQPFPSFHFDGVESGQGSEYGGTGGGSAGSGVDGVAGWQSDGPQVIDGSDSPGSRWGLTEERVATVDCPSGPVSVTVEPQWFNNGQVAGGMTGGGNGTGGVEGTGPDTGSAEPGVSDGQVDLSYDFAYTVDASEGAAAIQSAVDGASAGEGVRVEGSGDYEWTETVEVPDEVGLDISLDASFTIPDSHNLTTYQGANILTAATNASRDGAQGVTIQGGEFDFNNVTDETAYAGVWIHNATNSQIRDTTVHGAGQPVYGADDTRGFGVCITASEESGIYDSEAHDSGYDDIGIRGSNSNVEVIGCSGSGGSSGTIQAAAWGNWDIGSGSGENILIQDCSGERIYAHSSANVTFDNCTPTSRIQTIGVVDQATISNSSGLEGTVLLYTLDDSQPQTTIENMEWAAASDPAIAMGTNGGESMEQVDITDCTSEASTFLNFNAYDNPGGIDTVTVSDSILSGSTIVSQESGAEAADTVEFSNCEFDGFDTGITGSYGTVVVKDCTFNQLSESEAIDVAAQVQASGNTYNES